MPVDTPYFLPSPNISKTTFYAGSFGLFSTGVLLGVHSILKKEKMGGLPALFSAKIDNKMSSKAKDGNKLVITRSSVFLATRALGYGTLLCVGSFAGIISVFIAITGVEL